MSKCKYCNKSVAESKGGRTRVFCSKKCAQKQYTKEGRYNKYKKPGTDWGSKSKKKKEEQEKRKETFKWYLENWLTTEQVKEKIGFNTAAVVHSRAKSNNIQKKILSPGTQGGSPTAFWNPEDLDKFKQLKNDLIPDGWISTASSVKILGITESTFLKYRRKHPLESKEFVKDGSRMSFFEENKLSSWMTEYKEINQKEIEKNKQKRKQATLFKRQQKALLIQQQKEAKIQEELESVKHLWSSGEVADYCGWKVTNLYPHVKAGRLSTPIKAAGDRWFEPNEVKALKVYLDDVHSAKPVVILKNNNKKWDYEDRLINVSIPYWTADPNRQKSIDANLRYHNDRVNHGVIEEFTCTKCDTTKPYYEYRYTNSKKGRAARCKACEDKRYAENKQKYLDNQKNKWRNNHLSKWRTLIAIQVKRDMALLTNQYQHIKAQQIWDEIYVQCGYTEKELCEHLEANWEPWMNWQNHSKKIKGPRWEMDHIVPRSKLPYADLKHPNFKKCWSLSNLRPLEWSENHKKADS